MNSSDKKGNMGKGCGPRKRFIWEITQQKGERFILLCSSVLRSALQDGPIACWGSAEVTANGWSPGEPIDLDLFKYNVIYVSSIIKNVHVSGSPHMPFSFQLHSLHCSTDLMSCSEAFLFPEEM